MVEARCLAIIPARGGSQGIPRKNIKLLCGKPLIAWTIEAVIASRVDRVIVSTEDAEIANVARSFGAEVIERPKELAGGLSRSEDALIHALDVLDKRGDSIPDVVAMIQCTSPLIMPYDIEGCIRMVSDGGYDVAFTAVDFHGFLWRQDSKGLFQGINHDQTCRPMRQERPLEYLEVGAVYAMNLEGFRKAGFRFFGRTGIYPISPLRAIEIDNPDDWALAEALMETRKRASASRENIPLVKDIDLSAVRAVIMDFDGVLTDNQVYVNSAGVESVACSRADGWGIKALKKAGYYVACLSTETNPVVSKRCDKLGISCFQGLEDKGKALEKICSQKGIALDTMLYVGNDTNDIPALRLAGVAVIPSDASSELIKVADACTEATGGRGVIREITSALLKEVL